MTKPDGRWAIGIDIGGTFTDVVAIDHETGRVHDLKVLTTHADPADGVADALARIIEAARIVPGEVGRLVHATTLFTNALIERRGAVTGFVATAGFSDILEIGNERKYDLYDLAIEAAPPLVARDLRVELPGRLDANGVEVEALDLALLEREVGGLVQRGVESIGICLLHAYRSDAHERAAADCIARAFPQLALTLSSQVAPVIREFERMSTTVANAYIQPLANRYLDALVVRLAALGLAPGVLTMLSNGGLTHVSEAKRNPIELLESGPAAGAISAAWFGAREQLANLLAFDMGGTTAKLCMVEDGLPAISFGFEAARRKRFAEGSGLPIRITTIDLIEIGAGGGSIAQLDALELVKVGPESAGSEPGPACYSRGGDEATVTDANLLLGFLNPDGFAGGTMAIDVEAARVAIERIAARIDRDPIEVAAGMLDIVAENMAGAARVHVAERGRDPADFVLVCTGGGGPLHAVAVARKVGIRTVLCPPAAGVASAFGLLMAPARADRSRTLAFRPAQDRLAELETAYRQLEEQACASLAPLDANFGPVVLAREADGRFVGQGFNLTVRLPPGPWLQDAKDAGMRGQAQDEGAIVARLVEAFEAAYRQKYGRTPPDVPIELVNLRVSSQSPPRRRFVQASAEAGVDGRPGIDSQPARRVWFGAAASSDTQSSGHWIQTPVLDRARLGTGFSAAGPVLIEDGTSTLVVPPDACIERLASGCLIIRIGAGPA